MLVAFNVGLLVYLALRRYCGRARDPRLLPLLLHAEIWLDLIGLTLLLHFAGGAENPFFPFLPSPS